MLVRPHQDDILTDLFHALGASPFDRVSGWPQKVVLTDECYFCHTRKQLKGYVFLCRKFYSLKQNEKLFCESVYY